MKKTFRLSLLLALLVGLLSLSVTASAATRALGGFFKQVHQKCETGRDVRGEHELLLSKWAGLAVNAEIRRDYPQLAKAIEKINQREWRRIQQVQEKLKGEAIAFRKNDLKYYHPLSYEFDVQMRRADTVAVSFLQQEYTGSSGVHGMYAWEGVNLDPLTGAKIPLSAVVKDKEALVKTICKQLRQDYPHSSFDGLEAKLQQEAASDTLNWTLDPRGITFYFNPYEIASYAEGLLMATILFREQPELFNIAYQQTAAAYAQPFSAYYPLTASLKDNGKRDVIEVVQMDGAVRVRLNGQDTVIAANLTDLEPVLIHMEDGRNYLYIDGNGKDSVRQTLVVQLGAKSARYINTLPYSFRHTIAVAPAVQEYWHFLTNPNGFYIDRKGAFTSTTKTDICAVGEKGELTFG
ncbi:DUF3298 and DUF4163 domain-containing protein [Selenomonas ruminantium]|uniref:DUF3298 domain-containing protein n=1 Tax=Selenomonas ruminantium TaxID=971 RepID=A0A1K1NLU0_SELRU|nr:RsiV family protein [Selenomonas ruminantium]SFW36241.1 Protein of unknown function [Selenomonas ruminantium]